MSEAAAISALVMLTAVSAGFPLLAAQGATTATPRFLREIPWAGRGSWIAADTHVHTTFSDGGHSVDELVAKASQYGCRAVAITDHADVNLKAATQAYEAAITAARAANPQMAIVAGLEWNVPPWGGDEHASVLVPPGPNEESTLAEFKRRFDDYHRPDHASLDALDGLRWLAANGPDHGVNPVVVYNHPSRKDAKSIENVPDIERWRSVNDLVIGFEGGPGHQGKASPGDYQYKEKTIDRWDPAVARVGDALDTLLQEGLVLSGAVATSDFHETGATGDYWPCQFAETWLYVPEISPVGVLQALRAGSFAGVHGHIVRNVQFTVETSGLRRPAIAGEIIGVKPGSLVTAAVGVDVPAQDWEGKPNGIDQVELIAVPLDHGAAVASAMPNMGPAVFRHSFPMPAGGVVLRARGRRVLPGGDALMFYTNVIKLVAG